MDNTAKQELREFLKEALANHGDHKDFSDNEPLFSSGRLDSFSMMNLVMHIEESLNIDFSSLEFDVSLVDSVGDIERMAATQQAA